MKSNYHILSGLIILLSTFVWAGPNQNITNYNYTSQMSCSVSNQSGSVDAMCGAQSPIRCYAEIEYSNGSNGTIYGNQCWKSLSDCFSNGSGAVNPCD